MGIKDLYYYLFYKLYKFWDAVSEPKFLSDWKAEITIDILEILFGLSLLVYYTVASKKWIDLENGKYFALLYILLIGLPNYFVFHQNHRWKDIVKEYDKLPNEVNKRRGRVVLVIVILVV